MLRQPIVCVLGHVDHGKTSLLDAIRETTVQKREHGGITQHIGASEVPLGVIEAITKDIRKKLNIQITLPGLLFIDTPGHEAFTNLRRRGGSVADFAILVIDMTTGFQPQTIEALNILKEYKTPFVIAANKVDLIKGWIKNDTLSISDSIEKQNEWTLQELDNALYKLVGRISEYGFNAERFDRVADFTKEIVIVPVSAKTGEGIAELLMYVSGLTQKFLGSRLELDSRKPGKGSILEVKEDKGLGSTIDVILYEGRIRKGDEVIFATAEGVKKTRIKALLKPKPLDEIRDPKKKFDYFDEVHAASGVKIYAPELERALAGSPLFVVGSPEVERKLEELVEKEIRSVLGEREKEGVILKADTIGSLEAIMKIFKEKVHIADIGEIGKKDVITASTMKEGNMQYGVVLGFNVPINPEAEIEAKKLGVKILSSNVIYLLEQEYEKWVFEEREREKGLALENLSFPAKIFTLSGCCFRASKPAIFGIEILEGTLKAGAELMDGEGNKLGEVKEMQKNKENVKMAEAGDQLAISVPGLCYGRQVQEKQTLYTYIFRSHSVALREKFKDALGEKGLALLDEIDNIRRKKEKL